MNAMAPTRPSELSDRRVRLATGPAAAAEARRQVRAAICTWDVPVDPSAAGAMTGRGEARLDDSGGSLSRKNSELDITMTPAGAVF